MGAAVRTYAPSLGTCLDAWLVRGRRLATCHLGAGLLTFIPGRCSESGCSGGELGAGHPSPRLGHCLAPGRGDGWVLNRRAGRDTLCSACWLAPTRDRNYELPSKIDARAGTRVAVWGGAADREPPPSSSCVLINDPSVGAWQQAVRMDHSFHLHYGCQYSEFLLLIGLEGDVQMSFLCSRL